MSFVDVIARKRDGCSLSCDKIDAFIRGVKTADILDCQVPALLVAIGLRGMSDQETACLTDATVRSGDRVNMTDISGPKVGKPSAGGVGDKVSIVLATVVAACGVVLPKMSGRGLGHAGGTLDKLEAIPGFRVNLPVDAFVWMLADVGTSIVGQAASLVPADKALYALRDVTATVPSIPLIAASVMNNKIAEGSDALVLDVKCGHGAFLQSETHARELATLMVWIGSQAGRHTEAVITDVDAPVGRAVGNALDVIECVETRSGRGPADVAALVVLLACRVLVVSGAYAESDAEPAVRRALSSGAALEKMWAMVEWQGGDSREPTGGTRSPPRPTTTSPASRPIWWGGHLWSLAQVASGSRIGSTMAPV
jgi:pyrimidine-nucleoside phosphorylase